MMNEVMVIYTNEINEQIITIMDSKLLRKIIKFMVAIYSHGNARVCVVL